MGALMSRKNLLPTPTEKKLTTVNPPVSAESNALPASERNKHRRAFGAITRSIDELAGQVQATRAIEAQLMEGTVVVDLDAGIIDDSFVADRIGDDEKAFSELVEAIRVQGQNSPILVRPHPNDPDRYMAVFGHRRLRVAKALGRKVKAVVRRIDDKDHVIAQGQENSARTDLSFIEKAVFASKLEKSGYDRSVIMQALSVDKTVVSKMLSVATGIDLETIEAIGAAKHSGRDRWYALALKCRDDAARRAARAFTNDQVFLSADSDARLEMITRHLDASRPLRAESDTPSNTAWAADDRSVQVTVTSAAEKAVLTLTAKDGVSFANYITGRLEDLYEDFRRSINTKSGK